MGVHPALLETESVSGQQPGSALLGGSSLCAAAIEAICAFFVAFSKLGILVAFTSFLSTVIVSRFHANNVRIPVLAVALVGAFFNLAVLWNRQRLRNRASALWRKRPLTARQQWRIATLIGMSAITIVLVIAEFWIHPVHRF